MLRDLLEIQAASPHSWLAEAIERMRAFAAALARPDGAPALFNDGTVDAPRLELPEPPEGLSVFADSGFVVVREGALWLAFRCGRAVAGVPAGARARGRAVVSALVARPPGRRRSGHVHVRARRGPRLVPLDARALDGDASTAATSSGSGARSAAARCRR